MRILATLLFGLVTALAPFAQAQDLPVRVGRLAHIEGRVSLYQDPEAGWELGYVNSPITSENSVWADDGSRAELRVSGTAIRLDRLTQLDVARLDESELDAFVARGSVAVRVRHYESNERLVFSTPNARVRLRANGRYRIDFDPARYETHVTVFTGEARVGTDDGRMRVAAGRSVVIFGDPPEFFEEPARSGDFDRWALARDDRWREGRAPTYVSTYMTGYEDLDANGRWSNEPDYGALWYPTRVAADWAPYRYGRWDYVRPWGWTWIDDAPWGYAPFHYGRWVYVRNRWAWHPGERVARPVWAPALVAWIGGSNFSVGVSSGGPTVGWYPLSPWDRYQPWYQASPTYVNRVNVIVRSEPARQDRRDWQRFTRERGTTVVERAAMVDSRPIRQAALPVTAEAIRQAQVTPRPEAVLPSRNDVLQRRRERPQQAAPAPTAPAVARAPSSAPPGAPAQSPPGRAAVVRPDFGRGAVVAAPQPATEASRQTQRTNPGIARDGQRAQREAQQAQERAAREAQQQTQQQQQAQERAQREQQQAQERAAREAQQQQQRQGQEKAQQQQQAQERAQREQQQAQERAAREAQQQQQRRGQEKAQQEKQAQERAQREQQQAQERAAREAQQQQQKQGQEKAQQERQAQERAQREQQQAQERAAREAQQQRQAQEKAQQEKQAQERAAREAQQQRQAQEKAQQEKQAQERAAREAQQQQQRQAQEKAQREQQQAQERAAREAQQAQQRAQQQQQQQAQEKAQRDQQQAQERAAREAQQAQERAQREAQQKAKAKKDEEDEKEKEKGKGKGKQ
jgi:hypothetical protein